MKQYLITAAALLFAATTAHASVIEDNIERDPNFAAVKAKATEMLKQKGYTVTDIDADDYRGRPSLDVEAYKSSGFNSLAEEYEIKLSYPDLTILKEKRD